MSAHGSVCQVPGVAEDSAAVGPGAEWQLPTLWATSQQWLLWAAAAEVLLLVLCFLLQKRSYEPGPSSNNVDETEKDEGNNAVVKKVLEMSPNTQS